MIFLGQDFFGNKQNLNYSDMNGINSLTINNGIYDDLFVTKDIKNEDIKWDFNTVLYAMFKNDLLAGNIGYALETVTSIRIKMREKGEFNWHTIKEIPINTVNDLKFIVNYSYCKGNTNYEFATIPVLNGNIEGNLSISECESKFDGVYLVEPNAILHMWLNYKMSQQRNQSSSVVTTLGRNKPYYIANGMCNYDSGSMNVTFIGLKDNCELDIDSGSLYRRYIDDILTNKQPKVLKCDDGRTWIVGITDNISQDNTSLNNPVPIHTINWSEIADYEDPYDMYLNGFNEVYLGNEG